MVIVNAALSLELGELSISRRRKAIDDVSIVDVDHHVHARAVGEELPEVARVVPPGGSTQRAKPAAQVPDMRGGRWLSMSGRASG